MDNRQIIQAIRCLAARQPGQYQALFKALEAGAIPVDGLMDLQRLLRNFDDEVSREKRTFKPFPGGPRIRM